MLFGWVDSAARKSAPKEPAGGAVAGAAGATGTAQPDGDSKIFMAASYPLGKQSLVAAVEYRGGKGFRKALFQLIFNFNLLIEYFICIFSAFTIAIN